MGSVKERLKQWESAAVPLTPEAQERKLREEREKQRKAVKIARARAARYNMTLRSLAIKTVREQSEQQKKDAQAVMEAKERAKKYVMTSRALTIVSNKNQRNLAKTFDPDVDPQLAKDMIKAVAKHQVETEAAINDPSASEKQRMSAAAKALDLPVIESDEEDDEDRVKEEPLNRSSAESSSPKAAAAEEEDEDDDEEQDAAKAADDDEDPEEDEDEDAGIVNEDLARAVAQGDEQGVNRAILKSFLEEHAPERLDEIDELLEKYQGLDVSQLFEELAATYPDPAEAEYEGEHKALEDIKESGVPEPVDDEQDDDDEGDDEDDDEEDDGLDAVERHRREAEAAEKREKDKVARMSDEEREEYFAEKERERQHAEKKDAMLKQQLDIYAKGANKENPVLSAVRGATSTRRGVSKRVSRKVEKEEADAKPRQPSVVSEGFVLSAGEQKRQSAERGSASSKWAVNVQPQLLRERMKKAGVPDKDIDALLAEESDML
ncbi:Uncharacterized protein SCF082_LOCUS22293 [Durusdinium trenchii]|uniref:Uncharacterized protein n=1 Tax=Durusdinium trenchii TaxID=1381693 RepID=A0ABP0LEX1_9DINO